MHYGECFLAGVYTFRFAVDDDTPSGVTGRLNVRYIPTIGCE